MATLPDTFLGLGGFYLFGSRRFGVYAEGQTKVGSFQGDPVFLRSETVESVLAYPLPDGVEIVEAGRLEEWALLNVGFIWMITPQLAATVTGGAARRRSYRRFYDPDDEFPPPGFETLFFIVADPDSSSWRVNGSLGALLRASDELAVQAGYQLAPRALSLGLFFTIP